MSKLDKNLKDWVALGILSPDQAQQIRDHELARPESSWILSGLLILGAVIVGIGIISLIAANWYQVPAFVKLTGNFGLLVALAFWILQSADSQHPIRFEVLLLFFMILCLASIGLISQIYHTGGQLYQALLLWSLLCSALAFAARSMFVPFLWAGGLLTGIVLAASDSVMMQSVFQKNYLAIAMALPLLCAAMTIVSRGAVRDAGTTRAFRYWTLLSALGALVCVEATHVLTERFTTGLSAYWPGYGLAAFAAFGIWQSRDYRTVQKLMLLAIMGVYLIPFHLPLWAFGSDLLFASFTILTLTLIAVFLASLQERRFFQLFLGLIGIRFLVLYFQALGGLATTGFGLIVSGGLVIGVAILWNQYRVVLARGAERWMR